MTPELLPLVCFRAMRSQAVDIAVTDRQRNVLAAYNPGVFASGLRELGDLFGGAR